MFVFANICDFGKLFSPERQSAQMSKIANDDLTRSGTRCFIAVPIWQQCTFLLTACCLCEGGMQLCWRGNSFDLLHSGDCSLRPTRCSCSMVWSSSLWWRNYQYKSWATSAACDHQSSRMWKVWRWYRSGVVLGTSYLPSHACTTG